MRERPARKFSPLCCRHSSLKSQANKALFARGRIGLEKRRNSFDLTREQRHGSLMLTHAALFREARPLRPGRTDARMKRSKTGYAVAGDTVSPETCLADERSWFMPRKDHRLVGLPDSSSIRRAAGEERRGRHDRDHLSRSLIHAVSCNPLPFRDFLAAKTRCLGVAVGGPTARNDNADISLLQPLAACALGNGAKLSGL